uniref:Uncharacterized protein n=1 Tax=Chaetoceros debilis TaxID=122233 RepID=A0A7S3Q514_9STRA
MATVSPSEAKDTEMPEKSPASSPSISDPGQGYREARKIPNTLPINTRPHLHPRFILWRPLVNTSVATVRSISIIENSTNGYSLSIRGQRYTSSRIIINCLPIDIIA